MSDSTFQLNVDRGNYLILCEGYIDGQQKIFWILVDKYGKFINQGNHRKNQN